MRLLRRRLLLLLLLHRLSVPPRLWSLSSSLSPTVLLLCRGRCGGRATGGDILRLCR